jgi:hypothetical protein
MTPQTVDADNNSRLNKIVHVFDEQGRKTDGNGNFNDWWTAADAQSLFRRRCSSIDRPGWRGSRCRCRFPFRVMDARRSARITSNTTVPP